MIRLPPLLSLAILLAPASARADCAPPPAGPPMCLVGTIVSPFYAAAFLERPETPGIERVQLDGQLSDWRVLKITPHSVLLENDARQASLVLDEPSATALPPAGAYASESIAAESQRLRLMRKQQRQNP
jgi:hypothetical protein